MPSPDTLQLLGALGQYCLKRSFSMEGKVLEVCSKSVCTTDSVTCMETLPKSSCEKREAEAEATSPQAWMKCSVELGPVWIHGRYSYELGKE